MSIPSQLPQFVTATRAGALQALALQAGQMLEGKVIGPAPNGGTQVQIGDQMFNLVLPVLTKSGDTLKFEVQGSGVQLKLALQPAAPQGAASPPPATAPAPVQPAMSMPVARPMPTATASLSLAAQPQPAASPVSQSISTTVALQQVPGIAAAPLQAAAQAASAPAQGSLPGAAVSRTEVAAQPPGSVIATPAPPLSQPASVPAPAVVQPAMVAATQPRVATAQPVATVLPPLPSYPVAPKSSVAPAPLSPATALPALVHPAAAAMPSATMAQPVAPPAAAPMPSTAPAAIAQMVQAALPRQDAVTSLTVALVGIAGKVALPEPVARAAQQVLAGRIGLDGGKLTGSVLQKAILRSGIFQEATLARGGATMTTAQADMKSGLLALRQTLTTWLGQQAPLTAAAQIAPPVRGHVARARASDPPPIDPRAAPEEVGKQLLERTEAALSRVRLHQSASLPDPVAKTADWSMDLPVMVGSHQALLQLQIHRDEQNSSDAPAERGWQMRFAINLPGMGEVGAQVSLRGSTMGVMLWAAERSTSEALEAEVASLRETLAAVGLRPGAIIVRHGEPPAPPPAPSGHVLDART